MKRIGNLNGKTIVETSDLNTLKDNEVAIRYDGDKLTLLERNDNGEIVEISTGESELSKYMNTDIEDFYLDGFGLTTLTYSKFKNQLPKTSNILELWYKEHPNESINSHILPYINIHINEYTVLVTPLYSSINNNGIEEFKLFYDESVVPDYLDPEEASVDEHASVAELRCPIRIKRDRDRVVIFYNEI